MIRALLIGFLLSVCLPYGNAGPRLQLNVAEVVPAGADVNLKLAPAPFWLAVASDDLTHLRASRLSVNLKVTAERHVQHESLSGWREANLAPQHGSTSAPINYQAHLYESFLPGTFKGRGPPAAA
jgi:hypothetical protein